ncbi:hypothetical protein K449DRAFT_422290, partial [Hypoxylon sp. EC38]
LLLPQKNPGLRQILHHLLLVIRFFSLIRSNNTTLYLFPNHHCICFLKRVSTSPLCVVRSLNPTPIRCDALIH